MQRDRDDPLEDGQPVPQDRTFAIGDLHGEHTLLRRLLNRIHPTAQDTLIFLGDYVDRGEDSVAVCQTLLALQQQPGGPQVIALRGNHDAAWLEVWTGNGYRQHPLIPGARAIWDQYRGWPPLAIGRFLETTTLTYEDDDGFYCHAGIAPGVAPQQAGEAVYVWGTGGFLTTPIRYSKPIVFGHYELKELLITRARICLDTAAYRTGVLTAMQMETQELIQVQRVKDARTGD